MGKKNLDKLYQEKFKGFSEQPDEQVWQNIEASLNNKKKRRTFIPIWWKLGGAAAILLLGLFLWNTIEGTTTSPKVTDIKNLPENKNSKESKPTKGEIVEQNNSAVEDANFEKTAVATNNSNDNDTPISSEDDTNAPLNNSSVTAISTNQVTGRTNTITTLPQKDNSIDKSSKNLVTFRATTENEVVNSSTKTSITSTGNFDNGDAVVLSNNSNQTFETDSIKKNANEEKIDLKKKSIFDEIAAQKEEQEEIAIAENTGSKWSAGPSVAPIYYDAIGQGSPVHSIFVPNSKSGDISLSYGLSVAYEVSDKISIRSGLHKVDYGYNTNDIQFSSSLDASSSSKIDNVDFANSARNLFVGSNATNVEGFSENSFLDTSSDFSSSVNARNGIMEQQLEYLELPLELNYALIDKNFGVNLIGGVSSLFLVDNLIQLTSGDLTTEVGEANNINKVNFSTNIGFGLNYRITPKMKFNVEPMFKYQLNTFSQTEGTFRPFSVGVYSGLNFRF